jgi:L-lactate dehydrogenase (cytochrome)
MTPRQRPRWSELREMLRLEPLRLDRTRARLAAASSISELRALARRRAPRAVFDYVDGAADAEIGLARSRDAFARVEFRPRVLRDVTAVDPSTTILGSPSAFPLVFAPTGATRLMHHEGERAVARVARDVGIPYALSTAGTTTTAALIAAAPDGDNWFQLYVWRDRAASRDLLARVAADGYSTLVLTVDVPVTGARPRDLRNGLTLPPTLRLRTILDAARHPSWALDFLTTEPLGFVALHEGESTLSKGLGGALDPSVTLEDVSWLRETWNGDLVVKGILDVADARAVVERGADAVVVSNHGGRQLDRSTVPLEILPEVVDAIGDRAEVYLDGGILNGGDVVAAVALGARACLVGRAYLYGLMAGGETGVRRAADILTTEIRRTMQLLGVTAVDELTPELVRVRAR